MAITETASLPFAHSSTTPRPRAGRLWTGRVFSGLAVLFLGWDAAMKIIEHPMVLAASGPLGLPTSIAVPVGLILAVCLALYVVPRTAPLGAVLLTGYFGGAILVHLRIGDPLFSHTLFPIYIAAFVWGGLYLRDARVRALLRG